MSSIQQLKAEITAADYFNQEQKKWLLAGIDKAVNQLNIRKASAPKEFKLRTPKKASGLMTIQEWESRHGSLVGERLWAWAKIKKLDLKIVQEMIEEFKGEMAAKGKLQADFVMAFQTYLRKGYLSKPFAACVQKTVTTIQTKGNIL